MKLAKLADNFDKKGLHDEASIIDDVLKVAFDFGEEEGAAPEEQPDTGALKQYREQTEKYLKRMHDAGEKGVSSKTQTRILGWQKAYNNTIRVIEKQLGYVPSGLQFLKEDGIRGRMTNMAMNYVRSVLSGSGGKSLNDFAKEIVDQSKTWEQHEKPAVATYSQILQEIKKYVLGEAPYLELDDAANRQIAQYAHDLMKKVDAGTITQKQLMSSIVDIGESLSSSISGRQFEAVQQQQGQGLGVV